VNRRNWSRQFREAAAAFDHATLARLAVEYAAHLYAVPDLPGDVGRVLLILRQALRHEEVELVADAALAHGLDAPTVRRQYAQALVDGGNPAIALRLYAQLAADETAPRSERAEAGGGIGRCYKEMFLACTEPVRRTQYLTRSLDAYLAAYLQDPDVHTWHGINAVALLVRAAHDGIILPPGAPDPTALAGDILRAVDSVPVPDAWTEVTACEAAIALGGHDEALQRAEAFIMTKPEAFTVSSVLRQLQRVWQLDTTGSPGDVLLPVLRSALLDLDGGQITLAPGDVRAACLADLSDDPRLERVLGVDRFQTLSWYRTGLQRCRAVARVQRPDDDGIGTAFLVRGAELHPDLPPLVALTNAHVVPENLPTADAAVAFHGLDDDPGRTVCFRVVGQCWHAPSASDGLDTTVLALEGYPYDVAPVPVAETMPARPFQHRRAYVIGHPSRSALPEFSLQDNLLLDHDDRVMHYRSPTERGSSGSPVFDDAWRLIAVHHSGGYRIPRLNNAGGVYAANEGITVDAIRRGLAARPPGSGAAAWDRR
jgi:V8-like Glu-specific endopeptidase